MKKSNWSWAWSPRWIVRWILLIAFLGGVVAEIVLAFMSFRTSENLSDIGTAVLIGIGVSGVLFLLTIPRRNKKGR